MFAIQAKTRDLKDNLEILRKGGEIPAVFYGAGKESTPISVPLIQFTKVWHKAGESNTVKIDLGKTSVDTLIHEVQTHPITDEPIHVDFLAIDMNKKISVSVPVEFSGIAPAVKNGLGILVKAMYEIEVEALPKDLPHNIEIDISGMDSLDSQITVADIKLGSGVTVLSNPEEVVAAIVAVQEEKEEESAPIDLSAIEVEKKGKKEEEGGESGEDAKA